MLGESQLRYLPLSSSGAPDAEAFVDPVLARQARAHPGFVYYCADTRALFGDTESARPTVLAMLLDTSARGFMR